MDLTGKWRYIENYGYGVAEGELYLKQKGQTLAGRIVFTDKVEGESSYMIQEFLKGELEGRKVRLEAVEFDIIHSEFPITYQLDHWFHGNLKCLSYRYTKFRKVDESQLFFYSFLLNCPCY